MGKEKSNIEVLKEIVDGFQSESSELSIALHNIKALAQIAIEQENRITELELTIDTLQRQIDQSPRC